MWWKTGEDVKDLDRWDLVQLANCHGNGFFKKAFKATVTFIFPYWISKWGTHRDFSISNVYEVHSLSFASQPSVVCFKADTHLVFVFLRFGKCGFKSTASNESRPHYPESRHFLSVFTMNQIKKITSHRSYNGCTMLYWHYRKRVSMSTSSNSAPFVLHNNNYSNWMKLAKNYPIKCHYMTSVKCLLWKVPQFLWIYYNMLWLNI